MDLHVLRVQIEEVLPLLYKRRRLNKKQQSRFNSKEMKSRDLVTLPTMWDNLKNKFLIKDNHFNDKVSL